ncbi:unnamed protein product [Cunninghamella echinulata]
MLVLKISISNNDEENEGKEKEAVIPPEKNEQQQKQEETKKVEKNNDFGILSTAVPRLTSLACASPPTQQSTPRGPPNTAITTSHKSSQTKLLQQELEKVNN